MRSQSTRRTSARWGVRGLLMVLATGGIARADVAAKGTFGIDISVTLFPPPATGTFDGQITSFDAGPFPVGGTEVDLASNVGTMNIVDGDIPSINVPALAATFDFDAVSAPLSFSGAGMAVCSTDIVACAAGQATFVGDFTGLVDGSNLLPDGYVYTFDGTGGDNPGPGFDAIGNFGINAFLPVNVPIGNPVTAVSDPTQFYDSRHNVLRDFLIDVTFAEVSTPGTIAFIGKSAIPGALPANIAVEPDVSVFVDIVTGGGLAFTPPVDVCVAYDDVDTDGVVDGTSVQVNTLKLLHALALGGNFQDVTTSVGGGKVCGQVGTLSPFVVAVGPPLVTTTTSSTSTTLETVTTTSTTTTTTTSTLPTGDCEDALACIQAVLGIEPCTPEVLPTKLGNACGKKLEKAQSLIEKAGTATKLKKALKSVAKARSQVEKCAAKATKFVTNKKTPISAECNDTIGAIADVILTAIDEGRLGVPLPVE